MVLRKGSQLMAGAKAWKGSDNVTGWAAPPQGLHLRGIVLKAAPSCLLPVDKAELWALPDGAPGRCQTKAGWLLSEMLETQF